MEIFFTCCTILGMSILARASGGGFGKTTPVFLPELLFGFVVGIYAYAYFDAAYLGAIGWAVAFFGIQTGHGNAYHMGTAEHRFPDERETLDVVVRPLCSAIAALGRALGANWRMTPRSPGYCWVFMGVKGLIIGLPLGWAGLPLAILWPTCYWLSFVVVRNTSVFAEWSSGAVAGLLVALRLGEFWP